MAALLVAAFGFIGLAGWVLDVPILETLLPGTGDMKANTAVGLLLTAGALLAAGGRPGSAALERLSMTLALIAGLLGAATLAQYLFEWDLGIDELLFADPHSLPPQVRGRMSPFAATAFVGLAAAICLLRRPRWFFAVYVGAITAVIIGAATLMANLWNAQSLVDVPVVPPVALSTAASLILLGWGVLRACQLVTPDRHAGPALSSAPIEIRVLGALIGALIVLALGGGYVYRKTMALENTSTLLVHAKQVNDSLRKIDIAAADALTAQRGYFIAGDETQLQTFLKSVTQARHFLSQLRRLQPPSPEQAKLVAQLERTALSEFDRMEREIALFRQGMLDRPPEVVRGGHGMLALAAVREMIDRIEASEAESLRQMQASGAVSRQKLMLLLLGTLVAAMSAVIVLYRSVRKENIARTQAEQALAAEFDAAVERNRMLQKSQDALKTHSAEILRLNAELEKRAAEANSANRAKSTFLATMSHEIRTPMNGMLGTLELLGMSRLDADQRATLEIVRQSSASLLHIIDDILDFSKIEAGRLEMRPEVCSIQALIEELGSFYGGNASAKGIVIRRSIDSRISPAVLADPQRLRQILGNFLSNAIKFTSAGSIEIRAEWVERVDAADRVRISVKDTGIGISAQDQRRLFEPFTQVGDSARTRHAGGTGLGLTICHRLSRMMGGLIEVDSAPGRGTTMTLVLSLPIADPAELPANYGPRPRQLPAAQARRAAPAVQQAETEGTLVLVADDHPTNRALLVRQVQALGYAAEAVTDGVEAFEAWKSGRFGLVLTDCHMPQMDGYELTHAVRQAEAASHLRRIPIIACTANALAGEADKCREAGMDDYLSKPIELAQLFEKLDRWLPLRMQPAASAEPIDSSLVSATWGNDASVLAGVLREFRRVNDEDATAFRQSAVDGDMGLASRSAHRMVGASKMIGAEDFAAVCEHLELACRSNDIDTVEEHLSTFEHEHARLNVYIDSILAQTEDQSG